jgi:hypothetical protein
MVEIPEGRILSLRKEKTPDIPSLKSYQKCCWMRERTKDIQDAAVPGISTAEKSWPHYNQSTHIMVELQSTYPWVEGTLSLLKIHIAKIDTTL